MRNEEKFPKKPGRLKAQFRGGPQWLLVPGQASPQAAVAWEALRLPCADALALRASKKLRTDKLFLTTFAPTRLKFSQQGFEKE